MNGRFRLGAVLRARLAQEDVAKTEVVRARRNAAEAAEAVQRQGHRLRSRGTPEDGPGRAVAAALSARQALAAALSAAEELAGQADEHTDARMAALT